jgi:hypothetical protein
MAINAATGGQVTEQAVKSIADLMKREPKFAVAQNSVGQPAYSSRGIGYNSASVGAPPRTAVVRDEQHASTTDREVKLLRKGVGQGSQAVLCRAR